MVVPKNRTQYIEKTCTYKVLHLLFLFKTYDYDF